MIDLLQIFSEDKVESMIHGLLKTTILIISLCSFSFSQVPTLDPEQTINTCTGEMGFGLPLGIVNGVSGHNFPIYLNYQAGILVDQNASPAGLGFSYGPGGISRKVVYAADDNTGGTGNYTMGNNGGSCTTSGWLQFLTLICTAIGIMLSLVSGGTTLVIASTVASLLVSAVPIVATKMHYNAENYTAGGTHVPGYNAQNGQGKGFFNEGQLTDLPDIYTVSTPYLTGEMAWVGDPQTGHFVMRSTGGVALRDQATIKIEKTMVTLQGSAYTAPRMAFKITLADGTRLIFNEMDFSSQHTRAGYNKRTSDDCTDDCNQCDYCVEAFWTSLKEPTTTQWHLTSVLPPSFIDGSQPADDDPLNSISTNKGPWIAFEYETMELSHNYRSTGFYGHQIGSRYLTSEFVFGDHGEEWIGGWASSGQVLRENFFNAVRTPNEKAIFLYPKNNSKYDRQDLGWLSHLDNSVTPEPRLSSIEFYNSSAQKMKTVNLYHSYNLTLGYIRNPKINPLIGSLTLDSVKIYDNILVKNYPTTKFTYNNLTHVDDMMNLRGAAGGEALIPGTWGNGFDCREWALREFKDIWGYYFAQPCSFYNDWNTSGTETGDRYHESYCYYGGVDYDYSHPDAWSMAQIQLSDGRTLKWTYEKQRYDRGNGQYVKNDHTSKYGGGVRVKKMTVFDGLTNYEDPHHTYAISYFYTDQPGAFNESSTNSSGYATVEPFPFCLDNDPRPQADRGGLYSPAKVAYEMVQQVKNYQESVHPTPNGYTVYTYTHAGDPLVDGYHPNGGVYGDIDSSWERGLLLSESHYNKDNNLIEKQKNDYEFIGVDPLLTDGGNLIPFEDAALSFAKIRWQNTIGWVKLKQNTTQKQGVSTVKQNKYAVDLEGTFSDKIKSTTWDVTKRKLTNGESIELLGGVDRIASVLTDLPGTDPAKKDLIIAVESNLGNSNFFKLQLFLVKDIDFTSPDIPGNYEMLGFTTLTWLPDPILTGIDALKIPGQGDDNKIDLILQFFNLSGQFEFMIGQDIDYATKSTSLNPNYLSTSSRYIDNNTSRQSWLSAYFTQDDEQHIPTSSAICDLNGNSSPDFIFFHRNLNATASIGRLFAFKDGNFNSSDHYTIFPDGYYVSDPVPAIAPIAVDGSWEREIFGICKMEDLDGGGKRNDLIIGQGAWNRWNNTGDRYNVKLMKMPNIAFPAIGTTLSVPAGELWNELNIAASSMTYGGTYNQSTDDASNLFLFDIFDKANPQNNILFSSIVEPLPHNKISCINLTHDKMVCFDYNGQPNEIWETNSDGTKRIAQNISAFCKYSPMGTDLVNKHMLTQPCQTTIYQDDPTNPAKAVSSKVNTWQNVNGTWLPFGSFIWKVPLSNITGLPAAGDALVNFDFTPLATNDGRWKAAGSITKYSPNSNPIEVKNPLGIYSSTIFSAFDQPIASVANSRRAQCFFTSFEDYEDAPFTPIGECIIDKVAYIKKSGEKCIKINSPDVSSPRYCEGPWQECETALGVPTKFIFSGWVYSTGPQGVIYFMTSIDGTKYVSGSYTNVFIDNISQLNKWVFLSSSFIAPAGSKYFAIRMDNNAQSLDGGALGDGQHDVYFDDLKFYPANAKMNVTYYDPLWQQPTMSVDANENPSNLVEYDNFGRQSLTYKIDKNTNDLTVINAKKYYLMGESPLFDATKSYKIVTKLDNSQSLDIKDGNANISENQKLQLWQFLAQTNQLWKFIPAGDGNYFIQTVANPSFYIDDPFGTIVKGTRLQIYDVTTNNQKWRIEPLRDGTYRIMCYASGARALEYNVTGGGTPANGTFVQLGAYKNGDNQKWNIVAVP
jgi:hypothetical protein